MAYAVGLVQSLLTKVCNYSASGGQLAWR